MSGGERVGGAKLTGYDKVGDLGEDGNLAVAVAEGRRRGPVLLFFSFSPRVKIRENFRGLAYLGMQLCWWWGRGKGVGISGDEDVATYGKYALRYTMLAPAVYRMMPSQASVVSLTATCAFHQSIKMVLLAMATSSSEAGSESPKAQRTCEMGQSFLTANRSRARRISPSVGGSHVLPKGRGLRRVFCRHEARRSRRRMGCGRFWSLLWISGWDRFGSGRCREMVNRGSVSSDPIGLCSSVRLR